METFHTALTSVSKNAWFGSCDLKEAYYSISIDRRYRKYLRLYWGNQLYEYTSLPMGLTTVEKFSIGKIRGGFMKMIILAIYGISDR